MEVTQSLLPQKSVASPPLLPPSTLFSSQTRLKAFSIAAALVTANVGEANSITIPTRSSLPLTQRKPLANRSQTARTPNLPVAWALALTASSSYPQLASPEQLTKTNTIKIQHPFHFTIKNIQILFNTLSIEDDGGDLR